MKSGTCKETADLVIVFVKSTHTESSLDENKSLFGEHTLVMTLQNGAGNDRKIAKYVKTENIIIGTSKHNSVNLGGGKIRHSGTGVTTIGSNLEENINLPTIANLLTEAGFQSAIRCENLYPEREQLLKDPFGSDVEFNVRFDDFTLEYIDQAVQESLDAKYAGQEAYMIDGEELAGLHKSDILVEGEWEFTIVFGVDGEKAESVELICEPVMVEAQVYRKVGDDPIFYDVSHDLEQVKLTSFFLKPLGAELLFEQEEDVIGAFFEWQKDYWYGNRDIFVVMKDGSRIALHTASVGTKLTAETPIVLSEVDCILMGDGTKLDRPEQG